MTNPIALPPRETNFYPPRLDLPPSTTSFSSLPDEIVVSVLARISKSYYRSLCLVSKGFYSLLSSPGIYAARSQIGATEPRLYVCLWFPIPKNRFWFTLMNPVEGGELSLARVRLSSSYAHTRLNSTTVTVGFEIYHIGGMRSKAVRVLNCRSHTWRLAPSLTVARKRAKSCFLDGKIYVIGGDEKESMIWGEVFDIKTQTWKPLPSPSTSDNVIVDDSNDKVVVLEGRMYLITKHNNYAYDPKKEIWLPDDVGPRITGPCCCAIGNVMFTELDGDYKWYNSRTGSWYMVKNLFGLKRPSNNYRRTIQLVNSGGKLLIIWQERVNVRQVRPRVFTHEKRIWCAVVRLEERFTVLGPQIWGEVERCNVVLTVPKSSKLLSCLSVSV